MEWRENKSGGFNVKHIGMIFFLEFWEQNISMKSCMCLKMSL